MNVGRIAVAAFTALAVSGCALLGIDSIGLDGIDRMSESSAQGAEVLFPPDYDYLEEVDLVSLLAPGNAPALASTGVPGEIEVAAKEFEQWLSALPTSSEQRLARNRVQSRLIMASNQRCGDFLRELHKYQSDVNFQLGTLTTALAGAATVVTPGLATRILSGTAGVSAGTRAEFNSNYYRTLSMEVITKGINARRSRELETIHADRAKGLLEYNTMDALADALAYHASCTVIAGLEEASDAITIAEDPGMTRLAETFTQFGETAAKLKAALDAAAPSQTQQVPSGTGDSPDGAPTADANETVPGDNAEVVVAADPRANMRSTPEQRSDNSNVVAGLDRGQKVVRVGTSGAWTKIEVVDGPEKDKQGWIASRLLAGGN